MDLFNSNNFIFKIDRKSSKSEYTKKPEKIKKTEKVKKKFKKNDFFLDLINNKSIIKTKWINNLKSDILCTNQKIFWVYGESCTGKTVLVKNYLLSLSKNNKDINVFYFDILQLVFIDKIYHINNEIFQTISTHKQKNKIIIIDHLDSLLTEENDYNKSLFLKILKNISNSLTNCLKTENDYKIVIITSKEYLYPLKDINNKFIKYKSTNINFNHFLKKEANDEFRKKYEKIFNNVNLSFTQKLLNVKMIRLSSKPFMDTTVFNDFKGNIFETFYKFFITDEIDFDEFYNIILSLNKLEFYNSLKVIYLKTTMMGMERKNIKNTHELENMLNYIDIFSEYDYIDSKLSILSSNNYIESEFMKRENKKNFLLFLKLLKKNFKFRYQYFYKSVHENYLKYKDIPLEINKFKIDTRFNEKFNNYFENSFEDLTNNSNLNTLHDIKCKKDIICQFIISSIKKKK